jgi:hypothetical protein
MKPHLFVCFFILISTCCFGQEDIFLQKDSLPNDSISPLSDSTHRSPLTAHSLPADTSVEVKEKTFTPVADFITHFATIYDYAFIQRKTASPVIAGWLSAALPGAGQFYNKKYWKLPIVYAGFAGTGYLVYRTSTQYIAYRDEHRNRLNGEKINWENIDDANINAYRLQSQKNMQLSSIAVSLWYFINILDAVVDAHLMTYDISNNLSMQIAPDINNGLSWENQKKIQTIGLSFTLNLK